MKTIPLCLTMRCWFGYSGLLLLFSLPVARATDLSDAELTTVFSTVHNGYQREKLPDGSLKKIDYVFGEGTCDAGRVVDPSFDRLKFRQLARLLSAPLAALGYQPCREVNKIDQLIVIHWGRTIGWDGHGYGDAYGTLNKAFDTMKSAFPTLTPDMGDLPKSGSPMTRGLGGTPGAANNMDYMLLMLSMQEDARNRANEQNARMLGYYHTLARAPTFFGSLTNYYSEPLIQELEDDRYYVIVAAYDFQTTLKSRQPRILWITRFSLRARGNDFDQCIDRMIRTASAYFGRASDGLCREQLREGVAVPGKLEVIDFEEPKK